jgi:predicted signal transduction protein with EAL and GGDEF domain
VGGGEPKHDDAGAQRARARRHLSAATIVQILTLLGIVAASLSLAGGYYFAAESDAAHAESRRAALRSTISDFRIAFGSSPESDLRLIRLVEQSVGLKKVSFETVPADGDNRDMQPVVNADGRILGFLTWQPDKPMTETMNRLAPFIVGAIFGLLGFAGVALWQLRRTRRALAQSESDARRVAEQDPLTGLPTRTKLIELLDAAMIERQRGATFALLELDGLDAIAETYGQSSADEIVGLVGGRLRELLPQDVVCGRSGDHSFGFFWLGGHDAASLIRGTIYAATRPHWIDSIVRITAHAGFAHSGADAADRAELLRRAELALHAAQKSGAGAVVAFEQAIDAAASEQQFIRRELPRALNAKVLDVHYQPIVTSAGGEMVGVEALLRWTHKERGPISPARFVPIAEQMGLMEELGGFVLRRALRDAAKWPDVYVSVNLSPLQVRDRGIVDVVRRALDESGVVPSRLMLEITEGVLIDNPEEVLKRIEQLRAIGVRIALDDFGSGYSSLGYLQRFPFDKLKIDRSFVSTLGRSPNAAVIIQAIVALGRALGVTVVVEGVETEEQRVLLRLAGCDEMQGFLFARPNTAAVIGGLIESRDKAKSAA